MKRILLLIIVCIVGINTSKAQLYPITSHKDALKVKGRTLLVTLYEENANTLKKLKGNANAIANYQEDIQAQNEMVISTFKNYWNYTTAIEYKPYTEAKALLKANKEKYVLLNIYENTTYTIVRRTSYSPEAGKLSYQLPNGMYRIKDREFSDRQTYIFLEDSNGGTIMYTNIPHLDPEPSDLVYSIQQMQYILRYLEASESNKISKLKHDEMEKNAPELKTKTLFLCKEFLDEDLTEQEIKKVYPYPFKVVTQEELDKAIVEKTPGVAFVQLASVPGGENRASSHTIQDAETGKMYYLNAPNPIKFNTGGFGTITTKKGTYKIREKNLKDYAEEIGQ